MKFRHLATGAALAVAMASTALAHHSFAMFDQKKIISLNGTVREFQWTNPHAWIELDVGDGARVKQWSIELNSPNNLMRQGWKRTALRPGDKINVRISPLRNGAAGGLFLDLTRPDGTKLDSGLPKDGRSVNAPAL